MVRICIYRTSVSVAVINEVFYSEVESRGMVGLAFGCNQRPYEGPNPPWPAQACMPRFNPIRFPPASI